jgi:phosphopantothenoylcysteine decarboxylase/phosphopantothenate--cysteine ligase
MSILSGKKILLGVSGSIACYKAADLASKLAQAGALVDVILTESAAKFVSPLTFQSVTGRRAFTDADLWSGEGHIVHVGLGHSADLFILAPCTANTIAKLAHGIADNLVTITALAAQCPLLIAPAMDAGMYDHVATQTNVEILKSRGVFFAGPEQGHMASGLIGLGRMIEPAELIGHARNVLARDGRLKGYKVIVTAGGTQEPIDPVRVITNRSSGKQGYALAQAALDLGADVTLITAPTALTPPVGAHVIEAGSSLEMLEAVLRTCADADALFMAAAVADFRPVKAAENKIKKQDGIPQIELTAAPDILLAVARLRGEKDRPRVVIGFAAESRDLLENATRKLSSKKLDIIAANDISAPGAGFGVDTNRITLLFADGRREALDLMSKTDAAELIMARAASLLER